MTMPYKLADANTISEMHTGDVITARVVVGHEQGVAKAPVLGSYCGGGAGSSGYEAEGELPTCRRRGMRCRTSTC